MRVLLKEAAKEKKGWSLYKLAKILDLPQQTVYSWASGRTQPGWESMDLLCTVLECSLDDLFRPEPRTEFSLATRLAKEKQSLAAAYRSYKDMEASL